jgi:hypothetical protein
MLAVIDNTRLRLSCYVNKKEGQKDEEGVEVDGCGHTGHCCRSLWSGCCRSPYCRSNWGGFLGVFGLPDLRPAPNVILWIMVGGAAIPGGIYAVKRRHWGVALAGSICSPLYVRFWRIPALILVVLGKGEFRRSPVFYKLCESDLKTLR